MDPAPRRISHSEVRSYKNCRRQWYWGWFLGYTWRPGSDAATGVAQLGTSVHLALEAYYGHGLDPLAVLAWQYARLLEQAPYASKELGSEKDYAVLMVEGYLQWAAENGTDDDFEVIGTERLLAVPFTVTYPYQDGLIQTVDVVLTGRIDQTIRRRDHTQRTYIRDWKTVGDLTKANALARDEQMRWYDMLYWLLSRADQSLMPVQGVYYTMLKRSKRTLRATPPFYQAVPMHYNAYDRASMELRTERVIGELLLVEDELTNGGNPLAVAYPNPEESGHCRYCMFRDVCSMADDGSRIESLLEANYVRADPYAYQSDDTMGKVRQAFSAA